MKLSLLICSIPKRAAMLGRLKTELYHQMLPYAGEVEVLVNSDPALPIGRKRNELLQSAMGKYVAFIDDDDRVSENYISLIIEGIDKNVDCCSLKGIITFDGRNEQVFEHSLKYLEWKTNDDPCEIKYERNPNHLNAIRADIAKSMTFPETNHGEDHDFSKQLQASGLLKTEHYIPSVIYFYDYVTNK